MAQKKPVAGAAAERDGRHTPRPERAALVGLISSTRRRVDAEQSLEELAGLAEAAGASVVLRMMQERPKPDAGTFIGAGKVASLAAACAEADVDVVIVDHELTPGQLRQLEDRLERKVVDRTQLILDIFARRARTREGQLQVELAQLCYILPRLTGRGVEMSRLGGGIGLLASAHLLSGLGGDGMLEVDVNPNPLRDTLVPGMVPGEGGLVRLPGGPGLGAEPRLDACAGWLSARVEVAAPAA